MLKHPVFLVLLGFVLGFGVQYLLPKSAPESVVQPQPVAQPETPNVESTSTEPITQSTEKIETKFINTTCLTQYFVLQPQPVPKQQPQIFQ